MKITLADWKATRYQKRLMREVLRSGRLTYGPMTRELEKNFALLHERNFALFTSSGTAALKIALHALRNEYGWKDGDEIIIPAVTFVATMNAVLMVGLQPVLVDVEPTTINIDPKLIEAAITKRTRAIIPVHLLGQPANMPEIMAIAEKRDLRVVEDSCETMFVRDMDGNVVGSMGDIAVFSTYVAHLMVTGVGGFIVTDDQELSTTMRSMMFHGRDESYLNMDDRPKDISKRFWFPRFGYSDRSTEMEAALGLGDLRTWSKMIAKRQDNAHRLMTGLDGLSVQFPITNITEHAFMFFPLLVPRRDELMVYLEDHGIDTRTMMPLTTQPIVHEVLSPKVEAKFPVAKLVNEQGLLLPCHQYLGKKELDYMIDTIWEFYE